MMQRLKKYTITLLPLLLISIVAWGYLSNYHPDDVEDAFMQCSDSAPQLKPPTKIKVLSWNVQYMASTRYVFYYDKKGMTGPDTRPSREAIKETIKAVADVIKDEDPDIILLQEIDDGASRTDWRDQFQDLRKQLPKSYACWAEAFYWKSDFIPHPKIMGSAGMKLVTVSKYRLKSAKRYQLPLMTNHFIIQQFYLKRAILEVRLDARQDAGSLYLLNTHFDAFSQGTDTMQRQSNFTHKHLTTLTRKGLDFIIGGDFNLLPPGRQRLSLRKSNQDKYNKVTELKKIFDSFQAIPSLQEVNSKNNSIWFTHKVNNKINEKPDRTIDFLFTSNNIRLGEHYVRQKDTKTISDHFPVISSFTIP